MKILRMVGYSAVLTVLLTGCPADVPFVTLTNPTDQPRYGEIVELEPIIPVRLSTYKGPELYVGLRFINADTRERYPHQFVDYGRDGAPELLLLEMDFEPGEQIKVLVGEIGAGYEDYEVINPITARFVPERKDDFAWENDKIAYRVYGPALQAEGEISSGIDVWTKSVDYPIIDKWYQEGDYHKDHGEGGDFYKVGPSRGCGGIALMADSGLAVSGNYAEAWLTADGPLRATFRFDYYWDLEGKTVTEIKQIHLDKGSYLNRIQSTFFGEDFVGQHVVAGLAIHPKLKTSDIYALGDLVAFREELPKDNGYLAAAILGGESHGEQLGHHLMTLELKDNKVEYYAGAAWSKGGEIPDFESWMDYLNDFKLRLQNPIEVSYAN